MSDVFCKAAQFLFARTRILRYPTSRREYDDQRSFSTSSRSLQDVRSIQDMPATRNDVPVSSNQGYPDAPTDGMGSNPRRPDTDAGPTNVSPSEVPIRTPGSSVSYDAFIDGATYTCTRWSPTHGQVWFDPIGRVWRRPDFSIVYEDLDMPHETDFSEWRDDALRRYAASTNQLSSPVYRKRIPRFHACTT